VEEGDFLDLKVFILWKYVGIWNSYSLF